MADAADRELADAADRDELTMRAKRKTDPTFDDKDHNSSKSPKLGAIHSDSIVAANSMEISVTNQEVRYICRIPSDSEQENGKGGNGLDKGGVEEDVDSDNDKEDYKEDDDEEDEEEEDDSYEDEDDEKSEVNVKVDRKGKGVMKDDKGKGKLIEEVEDDSSSSGSESDDQESDLSDDPLAEVDLNNILPSRTRRRRSRPGVCIDSDPKDEDDGSDA